MMAANAPTMESPVITVYKIAPNAAAAMVRSHSRSTEIATRVLKQRWQKCRNFDVSIWEQQGRERMQIETVLAARRSRRFTRSWWPNHENQPQAAGLAAARKKRTKMRRLPLPKLSTALDASLATAVLLAWHVRIYDGGRVRFYKDGRYVWANFNEDGRLTNGRRADLLKRLAE